MKIDINSYKPSRQQKLQLQLLINLLKKANKKGVVVFVDGGYGLDALYGKLTRDHRDFDLFIHNYDKEKFTAILNKNGFYPTGKLIGKVSKEEFINTEFSRDFTIELGIFEEGLKFAQGLDLSKLIPSSPIGSLLNFKILTPTLEGFRKLIYINNQLAIKNEFPEYPHKDWMETILSSLSKKFSF